MNRDLDETRAFLKSPRENPRKRSVQERLHDWQPVEEIPDLPLIAKQSTRCMGCGVPFCQGPTGCPLQNLIPDWNEYVRHGRMHEALDKLHATNNFPEFTGTLCPAPCESACVLDLLSAPVTIRSVEAGIIEHGWSQGWVKPQPAQSKTGYKVAIIGSGPAGLAAAQQLARRGHQVVVFEKAAKIGGLLRYGIPDFKFDKKMIDRRISQLQAEGVEFKTGITIGEDISGEELQRDFHAIGLAIGANLARDLAVPGRELQGIHFAMDFLTEQNRFLSGESSGELSRSAAGKRVVILGGGDTGSDCLGTAHRQGASSVIQLELLPRPPGTRSERTPWPHWPLRLSTSHAHEEGGERQWSVCTTGFVGENGHVSGVRIQRCHFVDGQIELLEGTEEILPADIVILAMGFTGPEWGGLTASLPLTTDVRGNVQTDPNYRTSIAGVFAAGDARRGASLIVWAIAEGRKMAAAINDFLSQS